MGHSVGETFTLPLAPNPSEWRVISAGLAEGIGRAGAGRVTHVANGALNIATHVFFRPDVVSPLMSGDACQMSIELARDSGPLWVQLGEPPGQFVKLRPGGMLAGRVGADWINVGDARRFELREEGGNLLLSAGGQQISAGRFVPGSVELSAVDAWARLTRFQVLDADGTVQFDEDFRGRRVERETLDRATILGGLVGLALAILWVPLTRAALLFGCLGLVPVLITANQSRAVWLAGVERLYLSQVPPSQWASFALVVSVMPLAAAALLVLMRSAARLARPRGFAVWVCAVIGAALSCYLQQDATILSLGVLAFFVLSAVWMGGKGGLEAWWWIDAIGLVSVPLLGPDQAAAFLMLWRLLSVTATAADWTTKRPKMAVSMMLVSLAVLPLGLEAAVSASPAGDAWVMSRLSGERPNEKGWESPSAGWKDQCGDGDALVNVVVAGGSSVGGAYQFANEPEAFFSAIAHQELCDTLPPGVSLRTLNFGDGDRNTFTISRTIDRHLAGADILVLYVGVNDIFTTQNALTRKQREEIHQARSATTNKLMSWVSNARLAVGISLWFRPTQRGKGVADVPIADAKENHARIIAAAEKSGIKVLLMTEYVIKAQRNRLLEYSRMQEGFSAENVRWVDVRKAFMGIHDAESLADRNHLSRSGNQVLGRFLAEQLSGWI